MTTTIPTRKGGLTITSTTGGVAAATKRRELVALTRSPALTPVLASTLEVTARTRALAGMIPQTLSSPLDCVETLPAAATS
jgi:hypothetical protein